MKNLIASLLLVGLLSVQASAEISDTLSEWNGTWGENNAGAIIVSSENSITIEGNSNKNYGCVYKIITVDLDKTPTMVIDVTDVSAKWYIIAKHDDIRGGFVRVQKDTSYVGLKKYRLRRLTGLKGKQKIEFELGVSTKDGKSNRGQTVTIKSLTFE